MSRVASNQLNKKRRLERAFANELRKLYKKEAKYAARAGYAYVGFHYSDELEDIVGRFFKRIRLNKLRKNNDWLEKSYNTYQSIRFDVVLNDLKQSFNKMANSIQYTEKFSMDFSNDKVFTFAEEDEEDTWLDKMFAIIPARAVLISNVETQETYEATSLMNNMNTDEQRPEPELAGSSIATGTLAAVYISTRTKTWRSTLASNARSSHVSADGQTVNISEPFIVQGEELMYPGDRSKASPSNFMNCYCSVQYNLI